MRGIMYRYIVPPDPYCAIGVGVVLLVVHMGMMESLGFIARYRCRYYHDYSPPPAIASATAIAS